MARRFLPLLNLLLPVLSKLVIPQLNDLRNEGLCATLCNTDDPDVESDYQTMIRLQTRLESKGVVEALLDQVDEDEEHLHSILKTFCETNDVGFAECVNIERILWANKARVNCLSNCIDDMASKQVTPAFAVMSDRRQSFEQCLLGFDESKVVFPKNVSASAVVEALEEYGFALINDFFDVELMEEAQRVLTEWRASGKWKEYDYSDFASSEHLHTSANRAEVVLPFEAPFSTVANIIATSKLVPIMSAYANRTDLAMEYATSILSLPKAGNQDVHNDICFAKTLFKVGVAIHDTPKVNGPTGFCPCTHKKGAFFGPYQSTVDCPRHYQADFVPAGTAFLYDQAVAHQGMANTLRMRSILDISYKLGNIHSVYIDDGFSALAQHHVAMYQQTKVH